MDAGRTAVEPTGAEAADQAHAVAAAAARRAGVEVVEPTDPAGLTQVSELFGLIWRNADGKSPAPMHILRAFAHAGHYVAAARHDGELVGAAAGFLSPTDPAVGGGRSELLLHSHLAGVHPGWRDRHVGLALKLHQRAWALARQVGRIEWTFDPLVRRNAYFNVAKLGAHLAHYAPNFYGRMDDGINAGDDSDRCFVRWDVGSRRAVEASEGRLTEPDLEALPPAAVTLLRDDGQGRPQVADDGRLPGRALGLCWVPDDIVGIRAEDPERAQAWRVALRRTLGAALAAGCVVSGMTRSGWYVVEQSRPEEVRP